MEFWNECCKITVTTEVKPPLDGYPILWKRVDLDLNDFYCARLFRVEPQNGRAYQFAVLDYVLSAAEPYIVLEGPVLTVLMFSTILQINLMEGAVIRCVGCENMGGLEQICRIPNGYIIKGEGEIFRYDKALNRIWWRTGRDIFARPTAEDCFWLENDLIHCRDWEGWHYVLDMDGNRIYEFQEEMQE